MENGFIVGFFNLISPVDPEALEDGVAEQRSTGLAEMEPEQVELEQLLPEDLEGLCWL